MQKPAAQQKTVLETILDWSKDRPLWQVSLLSIADVTGVNNLAAGQTSRSKRQAMSSLPHARGGVSIHLAPQQLHFGSSPSPGGCLSIHRALFLIASALPECIWCFPRIDLHVYYQACSPA